jgi:hypothetical protein
MFVLLALQWGLLGGLAAEGYAFRTTFKRHRAYPWQIMEDPEGKACLDPRPPEELKPIRRGYFITVAITAVIGAATAVCLSAKWGDNPIMAIGVGFSAEAILTAKARDIALALRSWINPRLGDPEPGGNQDRSIATPEPAKKDKAEEPVKP